MEDGTIMLFDFQISGAHCRQARTSGHCQRGVYVLCMYVCIEGLLECAFAYVFINIFIEARLMNITVMG